jgi:hypothetical protein
MRSRTLNEITNALEPFASEEALSAEAVISTPATDPLSEFDSEDSTSPQPDVMTAPAGGLLPELLEPSRLADRHVALPIHTERAAGSRWLFEVKRYAAPAGIAAAAAIGLTIIVLDRPPAATTTKTTSGEPTAIRPTAVTGNHFPLVPALAAVSPAPLRELPSESPSAAQSNAAESNSAPGLTRRDTIVAAEIVPRSKVLPQPAVVAGDVAAAPPAILAATPVVPSPSAPVAAVRTTAALAPVDHVAETDVIQAVLGRYQGAFRALDSAAASAVWPTVDRKALSRAFERLEEQRIEFDKCQITIEGRQAVAACDGHTRYVPRVGNRSPRTEARQWTFTLLRHEQEWLIDRVETR